MSFTSNASPSTAASKHHESRTQFRHTFRRCVGFSPPLTDVVDVTDGNAEAANRSTGFFDSYVGLLSPISQRAVDAETIESLGRKMNGESSKSTEVSLQAVDSCENAAKPVDVLMQKSTHGGASSSLADATLPNNKR